VGPVRGPSVVPHLPRTPARTPPFLPPLLAFIDIPSIAFLLLLMGLALRNVRRPAIHKRFLGWYTSLPFFRG
jgi:hypothetical protein